MRKKENILLMVVWAAVIVTGVLAFTAIMYGAEDLAIFGRIHSLAVRTGLVYTAVYIFQVFWRKLQNKLQIKVNRPAKVTAAVAFHVVLHVISVHLAVAYTVYHAIHHGRKLLPVRVKGAAI